MLVLRNSCTDMYLLPYLDSWKVAQPGHEGGSSRLELLLPSLLSPHHVQPQQLPRLEDQLRPLIMAISFLTLDDLDLEIECFPIPSELCLIHVEVLVVRLTENNSEWRTSQDSSEGGQEPGEAHPTRVLASEEHLNNH